MTALRNPIILKGVPCYFERGKLLDSIFSHFTVQGGQSNSQQL